MRTNFINQICDKAELQLSLDFIDKEILNCAYKQPTLEYDRVLHAQRIERLLKIKDQLRRCQNG